MCTTRALCDHRSCAATSCAAPCRRRHNPPAVSLAFPPPPLGPCCLRNDLPPAKLAQQPCKSRANFRSSWHVPADIFRRHLRKSSYSCTYNFCRSLAHLRKTSAAICVSIGSSARRFFLANGSFAVSCPTASAVSRRSSRFADLHVAARPSSCSSSSSFAFASTVVVSIAPPFDVCHPKSLVVTQALIEQICDHTFQHLFYRGPHNYPKLPKLPSFWPPRSETTVTPAPRPDLYCARSGALPRNAHRETRQTQRE